MCKQLPDVLIRLAVTLLGNYLCDNASARGEWLCLGVVKTGNTQALTSVTGACNHIVCSLGEWPLTKASMKLKYSPGLGCIIDTIIG